MARTARARTRIVARFIIERPYPLILQMGQMVRSFLRSPEYLSVPCRRPTQSLFCLHNVLHDKRFVLAGVSVSRSFHCVPSCPCRQLSHNPLHHEPSIARRLLVEALQVLVDAVGRGRGAAHLHEATLLEKVDRSHVVNRNGRVERARAIEADRFSTTSRSMRSPRLP